MAIKVNDIIDHLHWGQGVVTEVGKDIPGKTPRAGTIRVRFMINGPEDWNLWVLNGNDEHSSWEFTGERVPFI